jgi:DNA polymerase-3 subunit epsilon
VARIAVIDVETTGLCASRTDRVVEIAVVLMDEKDGILEELSSLINPGRDVGPTRIHGITPSMVRNAPGFDDVIGRLCQMLGGAVAVAGHNVRFDLSFIHAEFERAGCPLPDIPALCTMRLAGGGKLERVCVDYEVPRPTVAHSALADARATAMVLQKMLTADPELVAYVEALSAPLWPSRSDPGSIPLVRRVLETRSTPASTYLQTLARRMPGISYGLEIPEPAPDPSPRIAYAALLAQAMEDRNIDDDECNDLRALADHWGLTVEEISAIHQQYLLQLQIAALADGVVTDAERADLRRAAEALGLSGDAAEQALSAAHGKMPQKSSNETARVPAPTKGANELASKIVCFTGESLCRLHGEYMSRSMALTLAAEKGINITDSLTKKVDLLVVADPHTQSGKAQKARKYGIPLMEEFQFWRAIGVHVEY